MRERFSSIAAALDEFGLDLARDRLPVAPAAHYCMGGIRTDTWGRTDVPGLYAAGETACTGVQGANRLASNSLLECLVFGARAAEAALADAPDACAPWATVELPATHGVAAFESSGSPYSIATSSARDWMPMSAWNATRRRLAAARRSNFPRTPRMRQAAPDVMLAALIARAALLRQESRGAHYRSDINESKPEWRGRIHWRRAFAPRFEEVIP